MRSGFAEYPIRERLQEREADAGAGFEDGDAFEIEIAVCILEIAQDREGDNRVLRVETDEIGEFRSGQHHLVFSEARSADEGFETRPALDRHDRLDVGTSGTA